jgi:pimeloyl-ACP methyl ester carboxylesterase
MTQGKYATLNGLAMYYEIYGRGNPLVLLHGSLGGIGMFEQIMPALAANWQVIAVELEGHGRTVLLDRPLSFEQMADDIAALIKHLGFANADLVGYSLGGGVALQTIIRHPNAVHKLVIVSAPCKSNGWHEESRTGMRSITAEIAKTWVGSPMHQAYVSVAPKPEDWTALAEKLGRMLGQDYDWSKDVAAINAPTLIVVGDADAVRTTHTVEFFGLLGGGKRDAGWDGAGMSNARLAILPGTTHYNIIASPMLAPIIASFLDAPMPASK